MTRHLFFVLVSCCENSHHLFAAKWKGRTESYLRGLQIECRVFGYPLAFLSEAKECPQPFEFLSARTGTVFPFGAKLTHVRQVKVGKDTKTASLGELFHLAVQQLVFSCGRVAKWKSSPNDAVFVSLPTLTCRT